MVAMKKKRDRMRLKEIEVERLVVREPRGGRARAVIETVPTQRGRASRVVMTLFAPDGEAVFVAEVDHRGQPRLSVGKTDRGPSVIVTTRALDIWSKGNVVAAIRSDDGTGVVEVLRDAARGLQPIRPRPRI
jgi:hypothetical protein